MLVLLGLLTLLVFTVLVMSKRMIAFTAIIVVPIIVAIIGGYGAQLGDLMIDGVESVAKTAVLLLFAVLYFGIMMDSGLFDPLSNKLLKIAKGDPAKIAVGTGILALLCALDGDGTTTYMIVCSAMLPVYRKIGMNPLVLATVAIMSLGIVAGMTPWGGSATRAISVLGLDAGDYFTPFIPTMLLSALWILLTAYVLGRIERKRIGILTIEPDSESEAGEKTAKSTWKLWFNLFLTIALMAVLIADIIPLSTLFMIAFVIALLVNFPNLEDQKKVLKEHGSNAIPVVSLVLGAGIFTGILSGTKMVDAMAGELVAWIPQSMSPFFTVIVAIIGIPLSFFMSNDAYFFGVVPVLAQTAEQYGFHPIDVARASVVGQAVHLLGPTSAPLWVLIELIRSDLGKLQKYSFIPILIASLAMLAFAVITGAISIR
ncbi:CitMHS family transporter [Paenibacillus jiagnxiensis]|uniref:CitMHS family transporter n=1 Tax=Paenibacillus jiagnxiensis TaxID=3228926 RepID=UPI0033BEC2EC